MTRQARGSVGVVQCHGFEPHPNPILFISTICRVLMSSLLFRLLVLRTVQLEMETDRKGKEQQNDC